MSEIWRKVRNWCGRPDHEKRKEEFMKLHKLGKRPPKIDKRTLKFAKYVKLPLPPVPPEVSWVTHVQNWPMYLNDELGDCTIAAAAHAIEQWLLYAKKYTAPGVAMPSDAQVLAAYEAVSGYRPNVPSTDNGCFMLDVLNYWRKTGIGGHKIWAFVEVNPKNLVEVAQAIMLFGNVYAGVALPVSVQGEDKWTVTDGGIYAEAGKPGSWGGHCVMIPAMSPITLTSITWGEVLKMSHNFFLDYCDEAYTCLSQDWIDKTGISPGGFDFATLQADIAAL